MEERGHESHHQAPALNLLRQDSVYSFFGPGRLGSSKRLQEPPSLGLPLQETTDGTATQAVCTWAAASIALPCLTCPSGTHSTTWGATEQEPGTVAAAVAHSLGRGKECNLRGCCCPGANRARPALERAYLPGSPAANPWKAAAAEAASADPGSAALSRAQPCWLNSPALQRGEEGGGGPAPPRRGRPSCAAS